MTKVLKIESSMRHDGSVTRALTQRVVAELAPGEIRERDLATGIPVIDAAWIGANFTDPEARTPEQREALSFSDQLVAELRAADVLVIGLAVYNFSIAAALKAWIDQVSRARETFRYTENGPVGLLNGKRAIVVFASGGTPVASEIDYATPYLRHALGFLGITDVTVRTAEDFPAETDAPVAAAS